jgi:hypothetical protein
MAALPIDGRDPLFRKLLQLLHEAFVEARAIGYGTGDKKLTDLGDTFEIIPQLMSRWEDGNLELIREILSEYHRKHGGRDWRSLLEMSEDEFRKRYIGPFHWDLDAAVEAPSAAKADPAA